MKRLLQWSNRIRLNNIKLLLVLLSIPILFLLVAGRGVSYTYAAGTNSPIDTYLVNLIYRDGYQINIGVFPPKVITIVTSEETRKELVFGSTTEEIVDELGIVMDSDDMTKPDQQSHVPHNGTIQVIKVDFKFIKKNEDIPYEVKEIETDELNTGSLQVKQAGETGQREKIIKITYEDNIVVASEVTEINILKEPIEKILLIGTKPATIQSCPYWDAVIDRYAPSTEDKRKNSWMKFVMRCETYCDSGQNTRNRYFGLYQFAPATFRRWAGLTASIWDGTAQIKAVAQMYDLGEGYRNQQWGTCNGRFDD